MTHEVKRKQIPVTKGYYPIYNSLDHLELKTQTTVILATMIHFAYANTSRTKGRGWFTVTNLIYSARKNKTVTTDFFGTEDGSVLHKTKIDNLYKDILENIVDLGFVTIKNEPYDGTFDMSPNWKPIILTTPKIGEPAPAYYINLDFIETYNQKVINKLF